MTSSSHLPRSDVAEREQSRVDELTNTYTASQLAHLLEANETLYAAQCGQLQVSTLALRSIARGDWTEVGARKVAAEALEGKAPLA